MAYNTPDTISAKEGRYFLDGEEVINGIKLELTIEKEKTDVKRLGQRMTGHRTIGLSGKGTMTEYHATSKFAKVLQDYKDTGKDVYFNGVAVLDDKSSGRRTERVVLTGINIDSAAIVNLDAEGEIIKDEIPFTIEDYYIQGEGLKDTF